MKVLFMTLIIACTLLTACKGQEGTDRKTTGGGIIGGGCDGCELMFVDMPEKISSTDTSAGWHEEGQKLVLTGTAYHLDGKTPASNVIIYYWHTDNSGYYTPTKDMDESAKRHGHIRGWVQTGKEGKYTIYTIRPAPYPGRRNPAHIHLSIKEPNIASEYYVDEIVFEDDKLLLEHMKEYPPENRGGSGIVRVLFRDSLQLAVHDIILGLHIPNYPKQQDL